MLNLISHERYYFYNQVVNMRKACYRLWSIEQNDLKKNILSEDIFVFLNKRHNPIKLLQWIRNGFVIYKNGLRSVRLCLSGILTNKRFIQYEPNCEPRCSKQYKIF